MSISMLSYVSMLLCGKKNCRTHGVHKIYSATYNQEMVLSSMKTLFILFLLVLVNIGIAQSQGTVKRESRTEVTIVGEEFFINGKPTFHGRVYNGMKIQGLLPNSRMVQGIFDDLNDSTRHLWAYPDTRVWDPERNTNEFVKAMPQWKSHGLLAFTVNLQGGSPYGYSNKQPWYNSAIDSAGNLRGPYMERLHKILDKADELGMVCILGIYYFGQDERVRDEEAVKKGVRHTVDWLHKGKYRNVVIEINNECNPRNYQHDILHPARVHELIEIVRSMKDDVGHRYLVTTSYVGKERPSEQVLKVSDFILCHGNGVGHPDTLRKMYDSYRALPGYRPMPIVNNEDDHFDFDKTDNNMMASFSKYVSWGYFDFRKKGEPFETGYQSVPCSWGIDTERKKGFFNLLKKITGAN